MEQLISARTYTCRSRGVAQPGSAPPLGGGGPRFESGRPDQVFQLAACRLFEVWVPEQTSESPDYSSGMDWVSLAGRFRFAFVLTRRRGNAMDVTGVLKALDAARAATRKAAEQEIKDAEARRDSDLLQLDRAERAVVGDNEPSLEASGSAYPVKPTRPRSKAAKGRVFRRRLPPASSAELAERCEKVARMVEENGEPVALGEIAHALGLTGHKTKRALQTLKSEGRIRPIGTGSATRYVLANAGAGPLSKQPPTHGTLEERIIAVLKDRHQATGQELAQALHTPPETVAEACGKLQSEERIRMDRFNSRPVYILAVRV